MVVLGFMDTFIYLFVLIAHKVIVFSGGVLIMKLCEKCGSLMAPVKKDGGVVLVCNKCGKQDSVEKGKVFKLKEKMTHEPFDSIPVLVSNVPSAVIIRQGGGPSRRGLVMSRRPDFIAV